MTLATQIETNGRMPKPAEMPRSEAIERALINGDLSGLSPRERWDYYCMRCDAADLDPRAQPFQYLQLSGKLVLYATKATTDQLISKRHLSVSLVSRGFDNETGLYEVHARVLFPNGQSVEDVGAVWIMKGEIGEKLANAIMKCVTKAKRRTVLSACGLGMLDETEVDTIPGAMRVNSEGMPLTIESPIGTRAAILHDPTNEPRSEEVSECRAFVRAAITAANDALRNLLLIEGKGDKFEPVANEFQIAQAMVSKWIEDGAMEEAEILNDKGKRDRAKVGAAVQVGFSQDPEEFKADVRAYLKDKADRFARSLGVAFEGDADETPAEPVAEEWPEGRE